ncbi:tetratricopeptide repeat protein [Gemmatimonas sp.]|jgi:tetratricopeptide (TPR) repeat protein|uniref:tetratricopeptide repeat protein n=1 Tax=Gemmatimonas sp. TaxID=1962908 RepID=UPI00261F06F4|nr:tetratricopeptide repeat protein [Gemmatimonas sp.]
MPARPCCFPDRLTVGAVALVALLSQPTVAHAQSRGAATPPATAAPSAAPPASPALGGAARWADSVRLLAERGYLSGDTTLLVAGYRLAQRSLTAFPDDPLLLHYRGYIRYRQAQQQRDFDTALPLFEESVALLERSVATRPLPETHALLASAFGSMIGDSMLRGIRFGMKASDAEDKAVALAPRNPRVLMLRAVSAWYKPAAFGGGEEKARTLLQQALQAFSADAPARPLPAWGRAEAYAWLGQMEAKAGNREAARAAYDQALALAPAFAWVQYVLKPQLERTR